MTSLTNRNLPFNIDNKVTHMPGWDQNCTFVDVHLASHLSGHYDVTSNRVWRHQQNVNRVRGTRERCVKIVVLLSFRDLLCRVRNIIMYVTEWWTVYALNRVLLCFYFQTNPKITILRMHKDFSTRVLTLFYIWSSQTVSISEWWWNMI